MGVRELREGDREIRLREIGGGQKEREQKMDIQGIAYLWLGGAVQHMCILFCAWTQVVCRQLGYNGTAGTFGNAVFGQGTGPIWMDNVACAGSESSLDRCPFNGWGIHNCLHRKDVGVVCQGRGV